jgi:hypothetical protein
MRHILETRAEQVVNVLGNLFKVAERHSGNLGRVMERCMGLLIASFLRRSYCEIVQKDNSLVIKLMVHDGRSGNKYLNGVAEQNYGRKVLSQGSRPIIPR